jgi:NAD(P)-dependent dehydrogenase (short-subunit alcohol dehydrogenase family)
MPQLRWLVTGCSSGIGEVLVRHILARGDKAIATTRGDVSRISALKEAGAETYSLDVDAPISAFQDVVAQALENGPIDVLVNNAGYMGMGMVEETRFAIFGLLSRSGADSSSIEAYQAQFNTNFFGVVKATQSLLPHFRSRSAGTIITIGSVVGISGRAGVGAVCPPSSQLAQYLLNKTQC